jgi:hypothetical protein
MRLYFLHQAPFGISFKAVNIWLTYETFNTVN